MKSAAATLLCLLLFVFALVVHVPLVAMVTANSSALSFIRVAFPWIWLFVEIALLFATLATVWK